MTSSNTPQGLAAAIESLVASYINELRRTAQQAVEHAFCRSRVTTVPTRAKVHVAQAKRPASRRSAEELEALCEQLYGLVCARPGEMMVVFADEAGVAARALERPMAKLKAEGRVRSVGQRNLTRYFPAVVRPSTSAA